MGILTRWLNMVREAKSFSASYLEKNRMEYSGSTAVAGLEARQEYKDMRKSS